MGRTHYRIATQFEGKHVAGLVSLTVEHFTLLLKAVSSALFPIKIFPFRYFIGRSYLNHFCHINRNVDLL